MANNSVGSIDNLRKKVTHTHELISTAYHEAGHTIYGLLHKIKINSVLILENKKTKRVEGLTIYDSPNTEKVEDSILLSDFLYAEIKLKYAGLTAEKQHFKNISGSDKFPLFLRDGSSDDTLSAAALIRQFNLAPPGKLRYYFKKKLIQQTQQELQTHWDAITLVAHKLFQKRKLDYTELRDLLSKKSDNKQFWKNQFRDIDLIYNESEVLDEKRLKYIFNT